MEQIRSSSLVVQKTKMFAEEATHDDIIEAKEFYINYILKYIKCI